MDPDARPTAKDMKLWVDVIRFVKSGARGGALSFFTYMELSAYFPPLSPLSCYSECSFESSEFSEPFGATWCSVPRPMNWWSDGLTPS